MSLYFVFNNLHFALELIGALVFFVMGWLAIDAYLVNKHYSLVLRITGFFLVSAWQIVNAFHFSNDIINFFGFSVYILGLVLLVLSIVSVPKIASVSAVLLIPSFSKAMPSFYLIAGILTAIIAILSFRQCRREFNKSLRLFWIGFAFLSLSSFIQIFIGNDSLDNPLWYVLHVLEAIGFFCFVFWVWQYIRLRVKESLMLIFVAMTLFIATTVTLAFSTILISKIEQQTKNNLLMNTKVFDFSVKNFTEKASAEAKFISVDKDVVQAVSAENTSDLEVILGRYLDSEKVGFLLAVDEAGVVLMRAHSPNERGDSISSERAVEEALVGNPFSTVEFSSSEKFSIRASSPIYEGDKVIGAIVAGFPLDNVMVDGIKKITGLDMTLYRDNTSVATTAISSDGRSRLVGVSVNDEEIKNSVLIEGGSATSEVYIDGRLFLSSYIPIVDGDEKIVGMFASAKPQADILDIANSTNRLTLITVTLIILLLTFPVYALTRRLLDQAI